MSFGESPRLFNQVRWNYYTTAVIDHVADILGSMPGRRLIDVGCGTGIATRQLAARGFEVVGTDVDVDMIEEAVSLGNRASYFVRKADDLKFPDERFEGATAFSAFHWFCDDASVREIKRVLQTGSCFVVVNRTDCGPFRQAMVEIVRRHTALSLAEPRASYHPVEILEKGGFHDVQESALMSIELLPAEIAVSYVRSTRFWEEVPSTVHDAIEHALRDYVISQLDEAGYFPRPITATIVSCRK